MKPDQESRRVLRVSGADARDFLQGLITNDIEKIDQGLVYTALLSPQGKYLADFFVFETSGVVHLDTHYAQTDALIQRLSMYKLRADVQITQSALQLHRGLGDVPGDGFADPRHDALGWRAYRSMPQAPQDPEIDWTAIYIQNMIPQSEIELTQESYILEMGFERLNGVDFKKGCYVGQEVTARMKHKTQLRKGLARVQISGEATIGDEITNENKAVGVLLSRHDDHALAYLRFDRAAKLMQCAAAQITWHEKEKYCPPTT